MATRGDEIIRRMILKPGYTGVWDNEIGKNLALTLWNLLCIL